MYAEHSVYLHRYLLKLTGDQEDAADLAQEVFLRLCQQERMPEYPRAWLSRTGYRLFVDHWRRSKRSRKVPLDADLPSLSDPEQSVLDREFADQFRNLLLQLHPRARSAFHMRIYEQSSYGDIARRLGCSENTIKTCIRRGKAQLSKWLG